MIDDNNRAAELAAAVTGGGIVTAILLQFKQIGELFRGWSEGRAAKKRDALDAAGAAVSVMERVMAAVEKRLEEERAECEQSIKVAVAKAVADLAAEVKRLKRQVADLEVICVAVESGRRLTAKQSAKMADIKKRVAAKDAADA